MPEFINTTPFVGSAFSALDKDGAAVVVAVLKATYERAPDGQLRIAERQEPIWEVDECQGLSPQAAPTRESDGAIYKPATDVFITGAAYAPGGRLTRELNCSLSIGKLSKRVQITGDRFWHSGVLGTRMSEATPFDEMPLCWERSFGGSDPSRPSAWEPRNPAGTGFCVTGSRRSLDGLRLPNFEDPAALISHWQDKPVPQGFGFTGRSWMPRIRYAGTYDAAWQRDRMPVLPADFDYRFWNSAAPGLVYPGFLRGGEAVEAVHLSKYGRERFTLPRLSVEFQGIGRGKRVRCQGLLDTVIFDLAAGRLMLCWRGRYLVSLNDTDSEVRVVSEAA